MRHPFKFPECPGSITEAEWIGMTKVIGLKNALSLSHTFCDPEWLAVWCPDPNMRKGWFTSPKGIFIVDHPYLYWKVLKSVKRQNKHSPDAPGGLASICKN